MITDEQVVFIAEKVKESSISSKEVRDDLVDHFCCLIEEEVNAGVPFDHAYQKAFQQTTPNGFDEVQEEVFFILNFNKIINMKRLTYIIGFIFTLGLTMALVFKLLHLPGANILLFGGIMGMAFLFAPLFLMSHFKSHLSQSQSEKIKWIVGAAGFMVLATGTIMKLLHLAGAAELLVIGSFAFGLGFLPFLFYSLYKQSLGTV